MHDMFVNGNGNVACVSDTGLLSSNKQLLAETAGLVTHVPLIQIWKDIFLE